MAGHTFNHWNIDRANEKHYIIPTRPHRDNKSLTEAYIHFKGTMIERDLLIGKPGEGRLDALVKLLFELGYFIGCQTGARVAGIQPQS